MDKLLSYLAARIELKVCDERRACEKHICNFKQQKKHLRTRIAMRSNGPQKQVGYIAGDTNSGATRSKCRSACNGKKGG